MTEETLEGLCLGEIQKVLSSRRGWRLMESNFTSVAIQLMYYTFMLYGSEDISRLDYALNAIAASVYQLHRL